MFQAGRIHSKSFEYHYFDRDANGYISAPFKIRIDKIYNEKNIRLHHNEKCTEVIKNGECLTAGTQLFGNCQHYTKFKDILSTKDFKVELKLENVTKQHWKNHNNI